ncbi:diguanylate phosphodiesterase [Shewanella xiamenensis]|uniref:EAL domain-containing protein n=1 Tax=Shewanella xiamenensis TaxID=332186 RepID=UPI0011847A00|nr:EAL domain-containing protein [Shewanella xiamenensis]TVL21164.1 diguanylate phosphodiesterase [Shewanella xiamenensis]TVL21343.1 diguanylate phosphodiesterase [Shewanella xiamenensis]TVL27371.1 diguanylate phosphodiesterase [Shewanella xiamenensis]TVL34918.1 diguanylate phosphodiesterase [Shewanella xiamenensis]TVL35948.1 diguanylate phosphodiesterase [Shewanella xiamenensis]
MLRISSVLASMLLFTLPILGTELLAPLFTRPMATYLLEQKVAEIKTSMAQRHADLNTAISKQLELFNFDCGENDMALLRNPQYYGKHIRLQGLELASGARCSTMGPGVPLLEKAKHNAQQLGKLMFTTTEAKFQTEQEVLIYYQSGENIAYWVLDNSWSHEFLHAPCGYCFYLEFNSQEQGPNTINFSRGDKLIKEESGSHGQRFVNDGERTMQTVWASKALDDYARMQLRHYGLWIGIILGTLLTAVFWLRRSYRCSLKGMLQTGLTKKEFVPFYQPVIDSRTHQIVGFEALLRWQRGSELIQPGAFINYAEEQGLILPMTEQLLEQVLSDLLTLSPEQWVSVNLVAVHIEQPVLRSLLLKYHKPSPERLTFELTERKPILNLKAATEEINKLQQMGYHFKLDDFGAGYGGFAYLQSLGIRQIKIDKMFVDTIGTNDLKRSILDAILAFGRESGMEMIAEGVETQQQVDYLRHHGVYLIQGYVYAKPMPMNKLQCWLKKRRLTNIPADHEY